MSREERVHAVSVSGSAVSILTVERTNPRPARYGGVDGEDIDEHRLIDGCVTAGCTILSYHHSTTWAPYIYCAYPYSSFRDVSTCFRLLDRFLYRVILSTQPTP